MFWLLCTCLTLAVALAISAPLWRRGGGTVVAARGSSATYDLQVYRDQLREVDRDLERRVISADDAARLRTEIGRKVLDADRRMSGADGGTSRAGGAAIGAMVVLTLLLAGAVGLYLREGLPGAADMPIAQRIADAQTIYEARPSQAEAEAQTPAPAPAAPPDENYAELVQKLREAVDKTPDDPRGLTLLATNEMRLGNIAAARDAQQKLVDLRADQASGAELMRLSALMVEAAGGLITPEGEAVLARALKADPHQAQARYLLGMLQLQNGRPDRAFPIWRQLLEEGPDDAPWIAPIRSLIPDLAWLAGHPDYVPPAPAATGMPALPGPDAGQVQAADELSPEQRQQMIVEMVAGLEARLAEQGGPPEEWARLITSLAVLGKTERADAIRDEARQLFGDDPEAMALIDAAANQTGGAK